MAGIIKAQLIDLGAETFKPVIEGAKETGKALGEIAANYIKDAIAHHPKLRLETVVCPFDKKKVTLMIQEQSFGIGHDMIQTVICSPYGKMDGISSGKFHGKTAAAAREQCMLIIAGAAHKAYHWTID